MEDWSGIKELYDVNLRLKAPLEINGRKYDINESILSFSKAEFAQITEHKTTKQARGGYLNQPWVNWEEDKEMTFAITNGVLSPQSWTLLSNSKLFQQPSKSVSYSEECKVIEDTEYCFVDLKYIPNACEGILGAQENPCLEPLPMGRRPELRLKPLPPSKVKWIFVYDEETGERVRDFEIFNNRIYFKKELRVVRVDYTFTYGDKIRTIEVGNRLINGFLKIDGKLSVKNEKSGEVTTALVEMPKIKLSSSLSMRLGKGYESSAVSDFYFIAYPDEARRREEQRIANITFLDIELTGDYI